MLRISALCVLIYCVSVITLLEKSYAQGCSDVLVKNEISSFRDSHTKLSYYYEWSNERFEKARKDVSGEGSATIFGVPIKSMGSYSEFKQMLGKEAKSVGYTYSNDRANSYITSFLPPKAINAWLKCMQKTEKLLLWVSHISDKGAIVKVVYNPGFDPKTIRRVETERINLLNSGLRPLKGKWKSKRRHELMLQRTVAGQESRFSVTVGSITRAKVLPVPPPIVETLSNGSPCANDAECSDGTCRPGPMAYGVSYCMDSTLTCAAPNVAGASLGAKKNFSGQPHVCARPPKGFEGPPRYFLAGVLPPSPKSVANGRLCSADAECKTGYCYPGPGDGSVRYCMAKAMNCALPGTDGVRCGFFAVIGGKVMICRRPGGSRARITD